MNILELERGMGKSGTGEKIKIKRVLGVSCAGGEGWGVELEARRGNPGVRRRKSEGSGIAGGRSWVAGDWSTGAGEDLGMSGNVSGGDHGGRAKERKTKIISNCSTNKLGGKSFMFLYKTECLCANTVGITTQMAKKVSAWIAGSGGLL